MYKKLNIIVCLSLSLLMASVYADQGEVLKLSKSQYKGLSECIEITFTAPWKNMDARTCEFVIVKINTSADNGGITIYLSETKKDSGIFSGSVNFTTNKSIEDEKLIKVVSGAVIYVEAEGYKAQAKWVPYDATVRLDKTTYSGIGVSPLVTLTDYDLNLNPNLKEEINVIVKSNSDSNGIKLKLIETNRDTGIFTGRFKLVPGSSNAEDKNLHIEYNDKITALYIDNLNSKGETEVKSVESIWEPQKAKLQLSKSSFSGLNSKCKITVADNDMNLHIDSKDSILVRVTSDADPKGFEMRIYETSVNSGTFAGDLKFNLLESKANWNIIKVNPKSSLKISYVDDWDDSNNRYDAVESTAQFQLVEAKLSTSSDVLEGLGGYMTITVQDPDADNNNQKNTVPVYVKSTNSSEKLTLYLEETGAYTGQFKGKLYFSEKKVYDREKKEYTIVVSPGDQLNLSYNDTTVPEEGKKLIEKTIPCMYDKASVAFNKTTFSGYNAASIITIKDFEANLRPQKIDKVKARVFSTSDIDGFEIVLSETKVDSGEFKATIYIDKKTDKGKNILKVSMGDKIHAVYEDYGGTNVGQIEAIAAWQSYNAELKLDTSIYYGVKKEVKLTLKDTDIANDINSKDMTYVYANAAGKTDSVRVKLVETGNNTGIFAGSFEINNPALKNRAIALEDGEKFEVRYEDENNTKNAAVEKVVSATWKSTSEPKLELDKKEYKNYDTYMNIKLTDFDENKDSDSRDTLYLNMKTKARNSYIQVKLTETGYNTGIFTARFKFTNKTASSGQIQVKAEDEVEAVYKDGATKKEVVAKAGFKEK